MTATATNKKPGLNLGKLSAVAQIAVKPAQPADAEIELARIYSVKQVRKTFRNLEELAESFKLNGIIEPLVVHEEADGRYRIIVGERRYRAAPLAGLVKVPVIIKKGLTELQIRRLQVTENNDRDDLTAYEEAMGVIEDVELYGTKEAMTIWNRGEAWVSKRMAVRRYADPVRELLENDLCGDFEVLHCLNQIYDIEDTHTEFSRLSHRMNEGLPLSRDEARNTLARMKAWKQQQDDLAQRRIELDNAKKAGDKAPEKTPAWLEEQRKRDAERAAAGADAGDQDEDGGQGPAPAPSAGLVRSDQPDGADGCRPDGHAAVIGEASAVRGCDELTPVQQLDAGGPDLVDALDQQVGRSRPAGWRHSRCRCRCRRRWRWRWRWRSRGAGKNIDQELEAARD